MSLPKQLKVLKWLWCSEYNQESCLCPHQDGLSQCAGSYLWNTSQNPELHRPQQLAHSPDRQLLGFCVSLSSSRQVLRQIWRLESLSKAFGATPIANHYCDLLGEQGRQGGLVIKERASWDEISGGWTHLLWFQKLASQLHILRGLQFEIDWHRLNA